MTDTKLSAGLLVSLTSLIWGKEFLQIGWDDSTCEDEALLWENEASSRCENFIITITWVNLQMSRFGDICRLLLSHTTPLCIPAIPNTICIQIANILLTLDEYSALNLPQQQCGFSKWRISYFSIHCHILHFLLQKEDGATMFLIT